MSSPPDGDLVPFSFEMHDDYLHDANLPALQALNNLVAKGEVRTSLVPVRHSMIFEGRAPRSLLAALGAAGFEDDDR